MEKIFEDILDDIDIEDEKSEIITKLNSDNESNEFNNAYSYKYFIIFPYVANRTVPSIKDIKITILKIYNILNSSAQIYSFSNIVYISSNKVLLSAKCPFIIPYETSTSESIDPKFEDNSIALSIDCEFKNAQQILNFITQFTKNIYNTDYEKSGFSSIQSFRIIKSDGKRWLTQEENIEELTDIKINIRNLKQFAVDYTKLGHNILKTTFIDLFSLLLILLNQDKNQIIEWLVKYYKKPFYKFQSDICFSKNRINLLGNEIYHLLEKNTKKWKEPLNLNNFVKNQTLTKFTSTKLTLFNIPEENICEQHQLTEDVISKHMINDLIYDYNIAINIDSSNSITLYIYCGIAKDNKGNYVSALLKNRLMYCKM